MKQTLTSAEWVINPLGGGWWVPRHDWGPGEGWDSTGGSRPTMFWLCDFVSLSFMLSRAGRGVALLGFPQASW
jgi:hypothetical protein